MAIAVTPLLKRRRARPRGRSSPRRCRRDRLRSPHSSPSPWPCTFMPSRWSSMSLSSESRSTLRSDPKGTGVARRRSETALDARGISCFATPSAAEFVDIERLALEHLNAGGKQTHLPHANQLWMLVGFALFARLRKEWECLEVYPQATAVVLRCGGVHKTKRDGLANQLQAAQAITLWPDQLNQEMLRPTGHGCLHDCLDAYLASFVASLPSENRDALGTPPVDVIWVPRHEGPPNKTLQLTSLSRRLRRRSGARS